MPYVDLDFYENSYMGSFDGTPEEFNRLAMRATELVDGFTQFKIPLNGGLEKHIPFIQKQVKVAVCSQIEYMDSQGGWDEIVGKQGDTGGSVRIGNFSYGSGGTGNTTGAQEKPQWTDNIADMVRVHLAPTGLLYRGVGVRHG